MSLEATAEQPGAWTNEVEVYAGAYLLISSTSTPRLAEDAAKPLVWMPWNTFSTVERSTTAGQTNGVSLQHCAHAIAAVWRKIMN